MKIIKDFIPKGRKNRPGLKMTPKYITIHETGVRRRGADAKAHANYIKSHGANNRGVSWHFTVDDKEIYQHLPLNENAWHAGDGYNGTGNRESIGIELCVNNDGNFNQTLKNAQILVADLMKKFNIPLINVRQHFHWTGKDCPHKIRSNKNMWRDFLLNIERLNEEKNENIYKVKIAYYTNEEARNTLNKLKEHGFNGFIKKVENMYLIQLGAFKNKQNAQTLANRIKTFGFNAVVIIEKKREEPRYQKILKVGDKVRIKKGAKSYNGKQLSPFVYNTIFNVIQIKGDRVVVGRGNEVTAAIKKEDLIF